MTTTTTTTTKQPTASPTPPSPPCSFEEDPVISEPEEPAVEKDTSVLNAVEKEFELAPDEPAVTHDDSVPDALDAWLKLEAQNEKAEEPQTPNPIKPLSNTSTALLEQNKYLLEGLSWHNQELLRQNQYLIEQLAKQNKFTIDRLVPPPLPPLTLCVSCGTADQKSSGSEKKKSKSSALGVDTAIRRILRIFSLIMLVVIAVQLGFVRGQSFEERNVRRTGFFGR
jgi:hypothetical protein